MFATFNYKLDNAVIQSFIQLRQKLTEYQLISNCQPIYLYLYNFTKLTVSFRKGDKSCSWFLLSFLLCLIQAVVDYCEKVQRYAIYEDLDIRNISPAF